MPRKMIPPLPESLGGSEHERFQRFAKAVLSVPKTEIMPAVQVLAKLQAEEQKVDAKPAEVRRRLAKRKTTPREAHTCYSWAMHDIKPENIATVVWNESPTSDRLGTVEITYKNGEKKKYEGDDLAWVVPQIKDHFPSKRPNLLSDAK